MDAEIWHARFEIRNNSSNIIIVLDAQILSTQVLQSTTSCTKQC